MSKHKKQRLMKSLRQSARTGQVPVYNKSTKRMEKLNIQDYKSPLEYTEAECKREAIDRVALNLQNTKHPFHHLTADGTIVTPDPTLEYYLSRVSAEERAQFMEAYKPTPEQETQAPEAVPVDRKYYGRDMYENTSRKKYQ